MSLILQLFSSPGRRGRQEPNGFKEEEDLRGKRIKAKDTGWSSLSSSICFVKRSKIDFIVIIVSKALPFLGWDWVVSYEHYSPKQEWRLRWGGSSCSLFDRIYCLFISFDGVGTQSDNIRNVLALHAQSRLKLPQSTSGLLITEQSIHKLTAWFS